MDDFAWLAEHSIELADKYAGKWIAVKDGRVIGVGDTAVEAAAQGAASDPDDDFILKVVEASADVIYGGA